MANHCLFKIDDYYLMQRGIDHFSGDFVKLIRYIHLRVDIIGQVNIWEDIVYAVTGEADELI